MSAALAITRIVLIVLSTVVAGCSIFFLTRQLVGIRPETWFVWTPLIVAILSNILYSCSLKPQSKVSTARTTFALILAIGWFVSPSYRIHQIVQLASTSTSTSTGFFSIWNCGLLQCTLSMIMDIAGLLAGLLALVELSLADRYSRGVITPASNKTSIFVLPGAEQQYIPLHQQQQQQFQPNQAAYYQPAQPYYAQAQPPASTPMYPAHY
ncbi:MAG: hypothetical protein J3R72DRAFT_429343 [Linnemannia gamsii]|nr:MAG: hypothetical protein J3R72DRAFT_429343 [Linnemannia gamsii]